MPEPDDSQTGGQAQGRRWGEMSLGRLFQGAVKWAVAAAAPAIMSAILAYFAGVTLTVSGLYVLVASFVLWFAAFFYWLSRTVEPLEWLDERIPGDLTLRQGIDRVENAFTFDIVDIVLETSSRTIGPQMLEFRREHPDAGPGESKAFWEALRRDAEADIVRPLDEEGLEELALAMSYVDVVTGIVRVEATARRLLLPFAVGSAAFILLSVVFARLVGPIPLTNDGAVAIAAILGVMAWALMVYVFRSHQNELNWWRGTLARLKGKDTRRIKREIERMEPPPFPVGRLGD